MTDAELFVAIKEKLAQAHLYAREGRLEELDELLLQAVIDECGHQIGIALLTGSAIVRNDVPARFVLFDYVSACLEEDGFDPSHELRGLEGVAPVIEEEVPAPPPPLEPRVVAEDDPTGGRGEIFTVSELLREQHDPGGVTISRSAWYNIAFRVWDAQIPKGFCAYCRKLAFLTLLLPLAPILFACKWILIGLFFGFMALLSSLTVPVATVSLYRRYDISLAEAYREAVKAEWTNQLGYSFSPQYYQVPKEVESEKWYRFSWMPVLGAFLLGMTFAWGEVITACIRVGTMNTGVLYFLITFLFMCASFATVSFVKEMGGHPYLPDATYRYVKRHERQDERRMQRARRERENGTPFFKIVGRWIHSVHKKICPPVHEVP